MAIGLKSDPQGFLSGELIDTSRNLLASQQQGMAIWRGVRSDVRAIARAIGVSTSRSGPAQGGGMAVPSAPRVSVSVGALQAVRSSAGGSVATPSGRSGAHGPASVGASLAASRALTHTVVVQPRTANGRFGSGGKGGEEKPGGAMGAAAQRMSGAADHMSQAVGSLESVDATVAAAKEVAEVVAPLGRGLFGLFGRSAERKKERWYNRFLKVLTAKKKDEDRNFVGAIGGGTGFLGTLLGSLFGGKGKALMGTAVGGGLLSRMFGRTAAAGAGAAGAAGVGAAAGGAGAGMLGKAGKFLKRVPVLGALLTGGAALAGMVGTNTRDEKYRGAGEAGGMIAGGIAGAKGGALLGALLGPVGAAVGGFLGGVGGALFGEVVGAKVGEWTKTLVDADIPSKISAAWTTTTTYIGGAWDVFMGVAKSEWGTVTKVMESAWGSFTKDAQTAWDAFLALPGVKAAVDKVKSVASDAVGAAWKDLKEVGGAVKAGASAALGVAQDVAAAAVPNTIKRMAAGGAAAVNAMGAGGGRGSMGVPVKGGSTSARAIETGKSYSAGNIGGLDDANTRALVASTAQTESSGGKLGVVNNLGFMGRYQAGAGWLAEAGLINGGSTAVRAAMKRDGHTREADWGKAGGMTKFLSDDKNWNNCMSRDKYLGSAEVQDKAFKDVSSSAYSALLKSGTINANTPQSEVMGLLKARHISGLGGAMAVARGGDSRADANGTSARTYYNHLAGANGAKVASNFSSITAKPPSANVPSSTPANIPPAPEVSEPERISSGGASDGIKVSINDKANQDVRDRRIAQIVSGGISPA